MPLLWWFYSQRFTTWNARQWQVKISEWPITSSTRTNKRYCILVLMQHGAIRIDMDQVGFLTWEAYVSLFSINQYYIYIYIVFINNLIFAISTSMWGDYYVGIMLCAPSLMSPICLSCKTNTHRRFSIWTIFIEIYLHPLSYWFFFNIQYLYEFKLHSIQIAVYYLGNLCYIFIYVYVIRICSYSRHLSAYVFACDKW